MASADTQNEGDVLIPLSPLDAIMGALGLAVLYVFPPPPENAPAYDLDRVRAAFISTIEEDYPLCVGKLHIDPVNGSVWIRQTPEARAAGAAGIPYSTDAESELSTDDIIPLVPPSFGPPREKDQVLTIKVTKLRDGGLVLVMHSTHALFDGEATFTFFKVWGMHYRGVPKEERPVINHDRHLVAPRGVGYTMEHPEFVSRKAEESVPTADAPLPQFPSTKQTPFHLSPEQLQKLKTVISEGLPEGKYVSTTDVVTALFLVLVTKARAHGNDVKITTGVNGRKRFDPPLPKDYAGNVIFNAYSTYTKEEVSTLSVSVIQQIALRVRASILRRDEEFMRDAIEYIAKEGEKWVEKLPGIDIFFGNDIMFTSWANFGMYDADFGAGRSLYTGPPSLPFLDGMVVIMDAMRGGTGKEVLVFLEGSAMDRLLKLWEECELVQL